MDSNDIQKPGQIIKPLMTIDKARSLIHDLYGLSVKNITEQNSYTDKNYLVHVGESWQNPHIEKLWPHGYIFKVLNSLQSQTNHSDAEHAMQKVLTEAGFNCSVPVLNVYGESKRLVRIHEKMDDGRCQEKNDEPDDSHYGLHLCCLFTFVTGNILHSAPCTPPILYKAGKYVAQLHQVMQDFTHPALDGHQTVWNMKNFSNVEKFIYIIRDEHSQHLVGDIITTFCVEVVPNFESFQKGVIHGDLNDQNILVKECPHQELMLANERENDICGIIDFGDMCDSYYVFEVAIVIMYLSIDSQATDPLIVGGHILAGYLSSCTLNSHEFNALKTCIAARYATSLTMGEYNYSMDPTNEYILRTAANGWQRLKQLWSTPTQELYSKWKEVIRSYAVAGNDLMVDVDKL